MIRGIYTAVSGLITQEAKQDSISNNLANVNTIGYKKDSIIAKKFDDVMIQNHDKVVNGKNVKNVIGSLSMGCKIDETYTNYNQGIIQSTNKDTDFAIEGKGFFAVSRDNGIDENTYYTRNGHFHVNNVGYLVNDTGDKVLAKNIQTDNLEPVYIGRGKIKCDESGNISINNNLTYKMYTADFEDNSLKKVEDNLYSGENPIETNNRKIQQNSIEKSNVDVMSEMADMMMTMRIFESNQKIVQTLDETLGKAVNEVGRA
ncbi:flagellar hook-basal body complex protein [Clostridium ganghwense]|uniref:Flagellar hook-basal body complex protein n=1 Tax=Clostridium ganghwense TaxID=312089 RepID=A0ABT4CN43_9CLOT|nr:flagellar hook-basal body complex protein [Clostridium ganghwense]MCY6370368.1 flagellar hook-basal body complex protein [Clostridium ganghwense]